MLVFLTYNHVWKWNKIISADERSSKIISNLFQRQWTCWNNYNELLLENIRQLQQAREMILK